MPNIPDNTPVRKPNAKIKKIFNRISAIFKGRLLLTTY